MGHLYRVVVNEHFKSTKTMVWAAFRREDEAYAYADELRRKNPTWTGITVKRPNPYIRRRDSDGSN